MKDQYARDQISREARTRGDDYYKLYAESERLKRQLNMLMDHLKLEIVTERVETAFNPYGGKTYIRSTQ